MPPPGPSGSIGQGTRRKGDETEESKKVVDDDVDSDEEIATLLKKVKSHSTKKIKKRSFEIQFSVGLDIFQLGLDNDNLFCGVVIENTGLFYDEKSLTLMMREQKFEMASSIPIEDLETGHEEFSFYFAASQTYDKDVLQKKT